MYTLPSVLLKADGLSSAKAGKQTEMSLVSVNAWMKRFLSESITGLQTRLGRGRKPIMDYVSTDAFFYTTIRALTALGKELFINYSHIAA